MKKLIVCFIVVVVIIMGVIGTRAFIKSRNARSEEDSKMFMIDGPIGGPYGNIVKKQPKKSYDCYTGPFTYVNDIDASDAKIIISSRQELEEYKNKFVTGGKYNEDGYQSKHSVDTLNSCLEKYDDEYFKDKSIALVYVTLASSSEFVEKTDAEIQGNSVKVNYTIGAHGDVGLCVMGASIIITEVDQGIDTIL
ncbi:MAG: hypothetical protein J6J36_06360 [Clostridia bacterium]|nr:hypothetical protein [Clostridia bacterium]